MSQRYPPIADYALIGDCRSAALVCRDGAIDWCCMPRFDSGACFARLLDREGGGYCSVEPHGGLRQCSREYIDGTLILRTLLGSDDGEVVITDAFVTVEDEDDERSQIVRTIEGVKGTQEL